MRFCKCDNTSGTYISFGGSVCCRKCFTAIEDKKPEEPEGVRVIDSGDNIIVKNNGETVKSFNRFEDDFACTNAHNFARSLKVKQPHPPTTER